jgi:hypothetical protein
MIILQTTYIKIGCKMRKFRSWILVFVRHCWRLSPNLYKIEDISQHTAGSSRNNRLKQIVSQLYEKNVDGSSITYQDDH